MTELEKKILDIIRKPQLSGLATEFTPGIPWVRYVIAVGSEDMTLRCATFVDSRKVEQIEKNPEVHLTCGVATPQNMVPYLQIQGRARLSCDPNTKVMFWNETLSGIFSGADDPKYGVLVIEPYRIEYCTPESYTPEVWEKKHKDIS